MRGLSPKEQLKRSMLPDGDTIETFQAYITFREMRKKVNVGVLGIGFLSILASLFWGGGWTNLSATVAWMTVLMFQLWELMDRHYLKQIMEAKIDADSVNVIAKSVDLDDMMGGNDPMR